MSESTPSNRQWKEWRKLNRKKGRQESGLFLAEGERCVEQILENGVIEAEALILTTGSDWQPPRNSPRIYRVDEADFRELVDTTTPQGVAAVCRIPSDSGLEDLARKKGVIVATDALQDPGNLGTILRSAVWFGAAGMLFGKGTVDPFHPKVVRSTAGATGALPLRTSLLSDELNELEALGWSVILLDSGAGSVPLKRLDPYPKRVIVIGNEANGVDHALFDHQRVRARIEGRAEGGVESLNAAVAAGIALHTLGE